MGLYQTLLSSQALTRTGIKVPSIEVHFPKPKSERKDPSQA